MGKKAIIFDLDNTVYPVSSIGKKLFKPLFELINESGEYSGDRKEIRLEIMRKPFQLVADQFSFSPKLKSDGLKLLADTTYNEPMKPFDDYQAIRKLNCKKFLVTTGFTKLQQSKIEQLGIEQDFDQIFIIDPSNSDLTKKDIFRKILDANNFEKTDLLVIGDDLNSEIKAAKELGIFTVLFDFNLEHSETENQKVIRNLTDLEAFI
ncbi:MAG: HAD family hydrolase [Candidatus Paceibacterota bacterium]|jgi:putative hydrolase of the HAD superfamily